MTDPDEIELQDSMLAILEDILFNLQPSTEKLEKQHKGILMMKGMLEDIRSMNHAEVNRETIERIARSHVERMDESIPISEEKLKAIIVDLCNIFNIR